MIVIDIEKLKSDVVKYVKLAQAGEEVIITCQDIPKLKLVPVEEKPKRDLP